MGEKKKFSCSSRPSGAACADSTRARGACANVVTAIGEGGARPATAADMRAVAHMEPDISADTAPSVDDAALIERSWREPERFTALFDRYYAEIHGYVARRLGPSRAEDVASETFLIAF